MDDRICSNHTGHEERIFQNSKRIESHAEDIKGLWEKGISDLQKEMGNKLNTRIFLAILTIITLVLLAFSGGIWNINSSIDDGFREVRQDLGEFDDRIDALEYRSMNQGP